jgi:tRNA-splicing endonuclease subunit Sen54
MPGPAPAKINPFAALRQGNKSVIIAVVDAGAVSFFKFGQGAFEEWPMAG